MHKHMQIPAPPTLSVVFASLALAASTAGCGGDSGACGVQPCGGDPVGNWHATSACADAAELNMAALASVMGFCATASVSGFSVRPSGTFNIAADMTYSLNMTMDMTVSMNIPSSCLMGASCAVLSAALQTEVGTGGVTAATCTGSSSCTCTVTGATTDASTGTYTTAGTEMMLMDSDGSTDGGPYCVQGSTLHLLTVDTTMAMAKIQSDIVLTK
jgi:hypothetical protein